MIQKGKAKKQIFPRGMALLMVAVMLFGVFPAHAEESAEANSTEKTVLVIALTVEPDTDLSEKTATDTAETAQPASGEADSEPETEAAWEISQNAAITETDPAPDNGNDPPDFSESTEDTVTETAETVETAEPAAESTEETESAQENGTENKTDYAAENPTPDNGNDTPDLSESTEDTVTETAETEETTETAVESTEETESAQENGTENKTEYAAEEPAPNNGSDATDLSENTEDTVTETAETEETTETADKNPEENAAETEPDTENDGSFETEATDTVGSGSPSVQTGTGEAARLSGEITVKENANGLCTAFFTIEIYDSESGTYKPYAYTVTGLKDAGEAREYAESLAASGTGTAIALEDGSLIDAEKLKSSSADSNLCWAASCADMLLLSGWSEAEGTYADEDALMDYYTDAFTNSAGTQQAGLLWFFEGVNLYQRTKGAAHVSTGETVEDGLLREYCADDMVTAYDLRYTDYFSTALQSLTGDADGDTCALGLVVGFYDSDLTLRYGGHAITVMGYATDENGNYTNLVVADSDNSCVSGGTDRTVYPNTLTSYSLTYADGHWCWSDGSYSSYTVALDTAFTLKYYSDTTAEVKEQGGTCDAVNYTDAAVTEVTLLDEDREEVQSIRTGETLYALVEVANHGAKKYTANPDVLFVLMKNGEEYARVQESAGNLSMTTAHTARILQQIAEANTLKPGEYSIVCVLDPEQTVTEAYYNNNTYTVLSFTVLGDKKSTRALMIVPGNNGVYSASQGAEYAIYVKNAPCAPEAVIYLSDSTDFMTGSDRVVLTENEYRLFETGNMYTLELSADFMRTLCVGTHWFEVIINGTSYFVSVTVE